MNPFSVARGRARALRALVLGERAGGAVDSAELISLGTKKHRMRVLKVDKASPRLNKADAVLFKNQFHICVRKDVEAGQQAFLIGHELGHVELHPEGMAAHKVNASETDVSPKRASGTQYVEAYGPRERAELQANVFSRELLLPRHVAVTLRNAGWSTMRMSMDLHLPLELVRQQLLDGSLLPNEATENPDVLNPLTEEQLVAAHDMSRFVNVVAGPGAGKTRTLIGRVQHLIAGGCPPHRILVLTFSNKAAREIVDRLQAANVPEVQNVWSGTFHAFGLEFIRKYHDYFEVPANVQVLDKLAQIEIASEQLTRLGLERYSPYDDSATWLDDMFLRVINRCREELVDAATYSSAVLAMGSEATPQQRDTARIFTAYEETLSREQVLDFSSLMEKPALALQKDPTVFEGLTHAFDHILVDEYQDVNRATAILLAAFSEHAQTVWVVGDPRQAIYRFRGASLRNLTEFDKDFPNANKRRLRKNWRTGPELVKFINHVGQSGPLQDEEPFQALEGNDDRQSYAMELASCPDSSSMHATLAARILQAVGDKRRLKEHLVLGRSNETIAAASAQLELNGVPCIHFGGIFERSEVRDLLSLFQLLVERFPAALTRVAALPPVSIPVDDVLRIQKAVAEDKSLEQLRWLRSPPAGLSERGLQGLVRLQGALGPLKWSSTPWDAACHFLLDQPDSLLRGRPLTSTQSEVRNLALWMLAYFGRTNDGHGRRLSLSRLLHRVRRRQRLKDIGPLRELPPEADAIDAVRLMTIHGSKGLEAEHVHLVDASDSYFKPFRPGLDARIPPGLIGPNEREQFEQAVEADNLLFVAVSRAEERLTLYEDQRWPHKKLESLAYYTGAITSVSAEPSRGDPPHITTGQPVTTTLEQVLAYVGCPRRYYYRDVLNLQASGDASAGARALSAAVEAAKRLCQHRTVSGEARNTHLLEAWLSKGLGDPAEKLELWTFALGKLDRVIGLVGGSLATPEQRDFSIGSHQLQVQLHCEIPLEPACVGGMLMTYDAFKNKTETRNVFLDLTSAFSPYPNKRPIQLINFRAETIKDTNPYRTGALQRGLDGIAAGYYPQRPEPAKCSSCAYLFICGC